jgi:ParB family transcriptional regulator, chromosome partitioning protein
MSRPRGRVLGRGLEALIPVSVSGEAEGEGALPEYISVDQVQPSPDQMRRQFREDALRELADSIKRHGLIQPVLVARLPEGFRLIAGERRWRAARMAGVERIPAIVKHEAGPEQSLLLGLIENLQREDLDPIEEARGIQRLIDQFGLTHEEAAAKLGKNRVAVTQAMRLLSGCPAVISATAAGAISAGHARALVGLPDVGAQELGLRVVLSRHLSVRQTERWVREFKPEGLGAKQKARGAARGMGPVVKQLEDRFGEAVRVTGNRRRGAVTIRYSSTEELDNLITFLLG